MKRLSLIDLHKSEIRKSSMAYIKGGADQKCVCSLSNPYLGVRQSAPGGGSVCLCTTTETTATVQHK